MILIYPCYLLLVIKLTPILDNVDIPGLGTQPVSSSSRASAEIRGSLLNNLQAFPFRQSEGDGKSYSILEKTIF